jgi:hypothetical protein
MRKFRKKPVVIEAFQLTEDYFKKWFDMVDTDVISIVKQFEDYQIYFYKNVRKVGVEVTTKNINPYFAEIPTLEGKPDIFEKTYEEVL